jgi:hypothetical protein
MQRMAVEGGGIETGIMLDYIPSGTDYREIEGEPSRGRLAALVVHQPLAPTPSRRGFVPRPLAATIDEIYRRGGLPREVEEGSEPLPRTPTRLETRLDPRRGLLRIDVSSAGADLRERALGALEIAAADVAQIDLRLAERSTTAAVDVLHELGCFFCAVLPEYLDGDVLRLQRPATSETAPANLVSDEAKRIFREIAVDRRRRVGR